MAITSPVLINDAPIGPTTTTTVILFEDSSYTVSTADLLAGFTDPDGDPMTVSGLFVSNGTVTENLDGTWTITPYANFFGDMALSYYVSDSITGTAVGTQFITVIGVNDAPTGPLTGTLAAGSEDTAYTVTAAQLLQGFSDIDGNALSIAGLTATNGEVAANPDGSFTITPTADYNGPVTLTYSVIDGAGGNVTATRDYALAAVNDGPSGSPTATLVAGLVNQAYNVSTIDLLAGFSDVDGDTLSVAGLTAWGGTVQMNADGSGYTITAAPGYVGEMKLGYEVVDGNGGSIATTQSYMLVANDLQAGADTLLVTRGLASAIDATALLANDSINPVADLSVTSVANAVGGTVALVDGKLVITASAATGSFDYTVSASTGVTTTTRVDFTSVVTTSKANIVTAAPTLAAADIQGQGGNDRLTGSNGADRLVGNGGDDRLVGLNGADRLIGGLGSDVMIGGKGDDTYFVERATDSVSELANEGNDSVVSTVSWTLGAAVENLDLIGTSNINATGNAGANNLSGNAGANVIDGRGGADRMAGGLGNDTYVVDNAGDVVVEGALGGVDTVRTSLSSFTLGNNVEDLVFTGFGKATLNGNDLDNDITGGSSSDLLAGGAGRDVLNGAGGADVFRFESLADFSPAAQGLDIIGDFSRRQGDKVDLSALDADLALDGDQAFSFIGTAAFSGNAGELRFTATRSGAVVSGDVDGDGAADFAFRLAGVSSVGSIDFAV